MSVYGIASGVIDSRRPLARPKPCPRHPNRALSGGPVHYHCPAGHGLPAADVDDGAAA